MYNDDFILSDQKYSELNSAYSKLNQSHFSGAIEQLSSLCTIIENNSFGLPLSIQNSIRHNLLEAREILTLIFQNRTQSHKPLNNNPVALIHELANISRTLNYKSFKSAYYILSCKANNIILQSIIDICKYYEK